ncbi:hypothetical protein E4O03_09220 [Treponema sp. OMZ 792]|uniref:hypothetical protein n=1 Tax=unclassified Treponema TaxID=2638727 RepID=UPI0020A38BAB|nr:MULTISPECIES: hypothetical protein [unclassified Treponema]UTC74399.1 hypothetical protein E4O03_09220 [Treponema sp. OMZ 792]UTC77325.1 hypothetical protein E4O04_04620 [Treponema sp. OMZ 799]
MSFPIIWNCRDTLAHVSYWLEYSSNELNFVINKLPKPESEEENASLNAIN